MSRRVNRTGLGLLDVVVGVMIVAVLAGLILPAIQRTRETSARCVTICHLGQIAKGLHNFASASPDGNTLPTGNWSAPGVPGTGPFAAVLPLVEQPPTTPPGTTVRAFVGPADTNSAGIPGLTSYTYNPAWLGRPSDLWPPNERPRLDRCPDGLANTVLVCEQVMDCGGVLNPWHANRGLDGLQITRPGGVVAAAPPTHGNLGSSWFGRRSCTADAPSGSHRGLILVATGDAGVRSFTPAVAAKMSSAPGVANWHAALTPDANDTPGAD